MHGRADTPRERLRRFVGLSHDRASGARCARRRFPLIVVFPQKWVAAAILKRGMKVCPLQPIPIFRHIRHQIVTPYCPDDRKPRPIQRRAQPALKRPEGTAIAHASAMAKNFIITGLARAPARSRVAAVPGWDLLHFRQSVNTLGGAEGRRRYTSRRPKVL
jgi:hypothetical protein